MRAVFLTTAEGGINRLRTHGGASPDSLYDLLNGYVKMDGSIVSRPGTDSEITLPSTCKGLCAHNGKLYSFTHDPDDLSSGDSGYLIELLVDPADPTSPIKRIHFARGYLGYLYVAAEFETSNVYHFWLQPGATWAAETNHSVGDVVVPTTPNGFAYRAHRLGEANPLWAAGVPREVGDKCEPTTENGYYYTVDSVAGDNPRSGDTEPDWIAEDGAIVIESADLPPAASTPTTGSTSPGDGNDYGTLPPPTTIRDRYDNRIEP